MAIMLQPYRSLLKRVFLTNSLDTCVTQHAISVQPSRGVRRRKPCLLGLAKSKWFIVPERPQFTQQEREEFRNLTRRYNTQFNSVCAYLKHESTLRAEGSKVREDEIQAEEEEWQQCVLINKAWNKQVAVVREERVAAERKERQQKVLQDLLEQEAKQQKTRELIDELVRKEKERSASYITEENIDEAIARAMTDTVDYNFSLDREGKMYKGRLAKPKNEDLSLLDQVDTLHGMDGMNKPPPVTFGASLTADLRIRD